MATSLKDMNRPGLTMIVIANAIIYITILSGLEFTNILSSLSNYESYAPVALVALIVGVLNAQLDPNTKARLVFLRWENPLPGSFAFTKVMKSDPRITPNSLRSFRDPLPTEPLEQNRLWFKWYREMQNEPSVRQVHREYLFTRDWSSLAVLLGLVVTPLAIIQMGALQILVWVTVVIIQYLLVSKAARNHGNRFVATVLANKGSEA